MREQTFWRIRLFPKVGKEWCKRTNRAVFTWEKLCREPGRVSYKGRQSTFNNSVRDAIRRGAAENELQYMKGGLQVLGDK